MMLRSNRRRLRLTAGAAALAILLAGCASAGGKAEPAPSASAPAGASPAATEPVETPAPGADATPDPLVMSASAPVSIRIPALELDSPLIETGMRADGTLEVPPGHEGAPASWYDGSPTPGERGASVLLGQVNSLEDDSGVFFALDSLAGGEEIAVTREDGSTARFEVYRVESFEKDAFPTREVYYPVPAAELRLITCDGVDGRPGEYPNNLVVFATLVGEA